MLKANLIVVFVACYLNVCLEVSNYFQEKIKIKFFEVFGIEFCEWFA